MRATVLLLLLCSCGCTHHQLRLNTVKQAQTLTNIYQQQVLDNLALFSQDPHAVPHFAVPSSGGSDVTDSGRITGSPLIDFRRVVGLTADRSMRESWTMQPVTDPDKLRRMRCAFQRAVGCPNVMCAKCCDLRKEFVGKKDSVVKLFDKEGKTAKDPATGMPYEGTVSLEQRQPVNKDTYEPEGLPVYVHVPLVSKPEQLGWGNHVVRRQAFDVYGEPIEKDGDLYFVYVVEEIHGRRSEIRLPNFNCADCCEVQPCWFETKAPSNLSKPMGRYVGRHAQTTIWVPPSGRDDLGRLVLEILDYALKDPPKTSATTKEVTLYLDEFGQPSNRADAYQVVKTQLSLDKDNIAAEKGKVVKPTKSLQEKLAVLGIDPRLADNPDMLGPALQNAKVLDADSVKNLSTDPSKINSFLDSRINALQFQDAERASEAAADAIKGAPILNDSSAPRLDLRELELNRRIIFGEN